MPKTYRDVERALREAGWVSQRTTGSHGIWPHSDGRRVVIPRGGTGGKVVPAGTPAPAPRSAVGTVSV